MKKFYRGEIIGNVQNELLTFYIEAISHEDAENKLIQYYESQLMPYHGEVQSISIFNIESTEYFGMKKYMANSYL